MHPAYKWGGSYPYHANAMHFAPNDDPRAKEISSHMKMDPNTLSSPYQPWLYGGNYCYHGPQECHDGYNHGGPYSFRPPYAYYPPPPLPFHTHGFYPPFPGAYPAYSFPPPHYSVEQPRYDYDKNTYGFHHCCGCNHGEDEKRSRIEQEEPKIEKKTSDSLAPFLIKDYPYPIMWVPPGFMNTESKTKEKEKHSHDHVPLEHLEPSKQGGNGETKQDQRGGDDDNPLPFPIFWFPSKNNEVGEKNVDLIANKTSPFSRSEVESEMGSKPAVQKVIPVKKAGTEEEKKSLENIETKVKSSSVEKTDNGMEGKASPKTSKLPPVCLRIDPLPRKKNGSRSPSPPGDKGRSKGSPKDHSKSSEQQTQLSEGLKKSKEEQSEGNIKTIKVVEKDSLADPCENVPRGAGSLADPRENVTRGAGTLADLCENVPKGAGSLADPFENVPKGAGSLADACDNVLVGAGNGSEKGIVCKAEKKKFSENEAALIIQSACRGFQVRKSKPITKLRQISEVGKQVIDLRNHIQELESSSSAICFDNKQKLVIGETIMSLLLKLDTIQGLHPMVREVRKRVAKELVGLQEKLDSLTSETPIDDVTKRVKDAAAIREKSETQIEDSIKREDDDDDDIQEKSETQIEDSIKREADDDGIKENSETQLDGNNVESAMNHEDDDGAESHNTNVEPQMELQNEESNRELNNKQLQVEVETKQPLDNAEFHNTNLEPDPELQNEESYNGRELNNKQLLEDDDDVIQDKIVAESESNGEVDDMIPKSAESDSNGEVGGMILKSAESDSNGEVGDVKVDDMIAKSAESGTSIETAAGCDMNAEPQSIEEVITKNEFGRDVEEEKDCQSEDSVNVIEDKKDVVVMDQLVKEQMSVIMELRARVKDLENKLSKNNNNKKMKKVNKKKKKKKKNKGRRSRGCVVEEELN